MKVLNTGREVRGVDSRHTPLTAGDRREFAFSATAAPTHLNPTLQALLSIIGIAERERSEAFLHQSEENHRYPSKACPQRTIVDIEESSRNREGEPR